MNCPNCGESCSRDEVDIGVGVQYGRWECSSCGWYEGYESDVDHAHEALSQKAIKEQPLTCRNCGAACERADLGFLHDGPGRGPWICRTCGWTGGSATDAERAEA